MGIAPVNMERVVVTDGLRVPLFGLRGHAARQEDDASQGAAQAQR